MPKEVISPQVLDDISSTIRAEIDFPYFAAMMPTIPEPMLHDQSLAEFCESISDERLAEFMNTYKKASCANNYQFSIRPTTGVSYQKTRKKDQGNFFMDGEVGLILGIKRKNGGSLWVGSVGICSGQELDGYDHHADSESKERMNFQYPFPVIVQLQGPVESSASHNSHGYERAREVLASYKWERALIGLVLEWAHMQNIPAVYLLPSWMNKWNNDWREGNFHMRYDVSAERMGFRIQRNGLYGISLLGLNEIVEDQVSEIIQTPEMIKV